MGIGWGSRIGTKRTFRYFRDFIEKNSLMDLGYKGFRGHNVTNRKRERGKD